MSTYSQFFSTNPTNLVVDPQKMVWHVGDETMCALGYPVSGTADSVGERPLSGADAWTILGASGFDVNQVTADDTYVTVANVASGAGVLTNLILPGVTAASDTVTVKVTVDGSAYTLAFTAENAEDRFFTGPVSFQGTDNYNATWSNGTMWQDADIVSGLAFRLNDSLLYNFLPNPSYCLAHAPCLRFDASLKVEMKSSDFSSTNNRDDCAAIYFLYQY